ncbi:MAG: hypothetical protein M1324_00480 [Patescibacteria group bacterium]|nr:hypothetical protein [Patescibacteria group bacterium]
MAKISISNVLAKKRRIRILTVFAALILIAALGSILIAKNPWGAKAILMSSSNADTLYVGTSDMLYIGTGDIPSGGDPVITSPTNFTGGHSGGGDLSKSVWSRHSYRMWSSTAPIWSSASETDSNTKRLNKPSSHPADGIYGISNLVSINSYAGKWTGCPNNPSITYDNAVTDCRAIISDGTGMRIKFNQKIYIDGLVYIADRVVLDAPEIELGPNARIIGSGQNGANGSGDSNGYGGVGGTSGLIAAYAEDGSGGWDWFSPYLDGPFFNTSATDQLISSIRTEFLNSTNNPILGGNSGTNSSAQYGYPSSYISNIGLGGGGRAGITGNTGGGDDHASSGGGGGGYGIVLKADTTLKVSSTAIADFRGGEGGAVGGGGGLGGGGGGGVIVVRSKNIDGDFKDNFIISGGRSYDGASVNGADGVFQILPVSTVSPVEASIKKTLEPYQRGASCTAANRATCFNPYALQVGDIIKVVLDVYNAPVGNWNLTDEYLKVPGGNYKCSTNGLHETAGVAGTCPNGYGGNTSCAMFDSPGHNSGLSLYGNFAAFDEINNTISWSLTNQYDPGAIYYYCRVQ